MSKLGILRLGLTTLMLIAVAIAFNIVVVAYTTIPSDLVPLAYINGVVIEIAYLDPDSGISLRDVYGLVHKVYDSLNLPRGFELSYVRVYVIGDKFYVKFMGRDIAGRLIVCYVKVLLSSDSIKYSIYEVGVGIDDPLVVNAVFKTRRSTFTRWVIEAVVKSFSALGLGNVNFTWFSLGFAEVINPEDKLLAAIYVVDGREYGVIYDWGRHVIIRTSQDLIATPVNALGLQRHVPTTTIAVITSPTATQIVVPTTTPRVQAPTTQARNTSIMSTEGEAQCIECIEANVSVEVLKKTSPTTTRTLTTPTPIEYTTKPNTTTTITQTSNGLRPESTATLSLGEKTARTGIVEEVKIVVVLASSLLAGVLALIVIKKILA